MAFISKIKLPNNTEYDINAVKATLGTAAGDIVYWSAASTPVRLAKGSNGQVLTLTNGLPSWQAAGTGVAHVLGEYE